MLKKIAAPLVFVLSLAGCSGSMSMPLVGAISSLQALAPHKPATGSTLIFPCSQVGYGTACSGGVITQGEINAFQAFADREALAGYRWLGSADGIINSCNENTGQCGQPYYVFQAI